MTFKSINPYTETLIAEYDEHNDARVESILAQAEKTYATDWRERSYGERAEVIRKVADLLENRLDDYAHLATTEMGKRLPEAQWEVRFCVDVLRYYADHAESILASRPLQVQQGKARVEARPLGPVLCIEPWNFPFFQLTRVAAPILMAGNTVVMKHAASVPQCALAFEKLFIDAGAPAGIYTNLFVSNVRAAGVIADKRIRAISLTGSERAGIAVAAQAGKALKKVTMELGGSDAFVVLDDANLDVAIPLAVFGRMMNTGQGCGCSKRFILPANLYEQFVARFAQELEALTPGDPLDPATGVGPLSSKAALDRALQQIDEAVAHGAKIVTGGKRLDREGYFLAPTILTDVNADNPVFHQEIFAPVAVVFRVESDAEAIALANDSPYGLGGSVISPDVERAEQVAAQIDTGMIFINQVADSAPNLPWGGVKNSGYGRELADFGITEFVNWKLIRTAE
ncbi:NAD-dependent succinate-semialdehyde dehydrogenase [Paraburkholderia sp. LEh10]|uniref:NAD-dependent succinate-semialdehyde dehydrogenase n=1 Tax=Paraburkholderia sp. LEh10 TaxID=2821353 RepID=UPI001AE6C150|nr:NAD-dependent succinate-semialdehyde dehydrogenase [Paraburkholderia sp. LEh10]MBP0590424.1 NAD-dependent succinate-semialdehyde dehydrogenase [Paraburkholderia sp. LEh10]